MEIIASLIGISLGLVVILTIKLLKHLDEKTMYGLILAVIGALYVGFTWMDIRTVIVCILQALLFLFIACYGIKKSTLWLAGGYFLHGVWDLMFSLIPFTNLIPPHYDLFCLCIDFTMGIYLIVLYYRTEIKYLVTE
jgi:hypothetical protein